MQEYGLIGFPLGHSFSAQLHNAFFAEKGIHAVYRNFELSDIGLLPSLLEAHPDLRGFNVTIPHKEAILPALDELDDEAAAVGAVNVVSVLPDGRLKGYNSDVYGFREALRPFLDRGDHRRALVLGTGGASRAVVHALRLLDIAVTFVSRRTHSGADVVTYADLDAQTMAEHTLIVNCTPVGTYPDVNAAPPIPYEALSPRHLCFDLVYNPSETLFMKNAAAQGATACNGLSMLNLQAALSHTLWGLSNS